MNKLAIALVGVLGAGSVYAADLGAREQYYVDSALIGSAPVPVQVSAASAEVEQYLLDGATLGAVRSAPAAPVSVAPANGELYRLDSALVAGLDRNGQPEGDGLGSAVVQR